MKRVCVITSVHQITDTRIYLKEVKSLAKRYETYYVARNSAGLKDEGNLKIIDIKKPENRIKRMLMSFSVFNTARKTKSDIYHFEDPELIFCGILLQLFTKGRVIYDVHEDYPDYMLQKEYINKHLRPLLSFFMKASEKLADIILSGIIVADGGVYKRFSPRKTEIIYNFPDISQNKEPEKKPIKEYDLIYPGTVSKVMLSYFIEITRELRRIKSDCKVLLITRFDYENMKKKIEDAGVSENLILMDKMPFDKVTEYEYKTKIGLIPLPDTLKFSKNIPTKLFEFMLCGMPTIASDLAPARSFAEKGDFAVLIKADDFKGYALAAASLLENEDRRNEMGRCGRELVLSQYNWQREEEKLFSFYERLLKKERR